MVNMLSDTVFFQKTSNSVIVLDENGFVIDINEAGVKMSGYSKEEWLGKTLELISKNPQDNKDVWHIVEKQEFWEGELWNRHKEGYDYLVNRSIVKSKKHDGTVVYLVLSKDITESRKKEKGYEDMLTKDGLTELPSKQLFEDSFQNLLRMGRRSVERVALVSIDIARFQSVNDSFGYDNGDEVLKEIAQRIRELIPNDAIMARINSDIFMVACPDTTYNATVSWLENVKDSFRHIPFDIDGVDTFLSLHMGVGMFPDDGKTSQELIRNADMTRSRVKNSSSEMYQFYKPDKNAQVFEKLIMENNLRKALQQSELELYYQPQISIESGDVTGVEALIRWNHPKLGLISPMSFIPLAEETGLILPIGEWTLREGCRQIKEWEGKFGLPLTMAINLSPKQFANKHLVQDIAGILEEYDIPSNNLELEITEHAVMEREDNYIDKLQQLRNLGIVLSIDDFGTGYSSLSYLAKFPIDFLKIDRSFVLKMLSSKVDSTIIYTIIAMAHELGLDVVAEGVESEDHLKMLGGMKCDYAQGYHIAKPMRKEEVEEFIKNNPFKKKNLNQ
ncbi:hypothetical protein bcgnr5390_13760 [Bacillus luti]|nr:hypothetical protein BC2903_54820 [Bacillus cereus]